jgi:hypothetical protein
MLLQAPSPTTNRAVVNNRVVDFIDITFILLKLVNFDWW